MGTSTSYRGPAVPRWQAFRAALRQGAEIDRLRSELFNAGREWETAIAATSMAAFASRVAELYTDLPDQIRTSNRPEQAISDAAARAVTAVGEFADGTPALPLAERALVGVLLRTTAGDTSLTTLSASEAAERFVAARGAENEFVGRYVGELLAQYARHVTAREIGSLTESGGPGQKLGEATTVTASRRLIRQLAVAAAEVGSDAALQSGETRTLLASWHAVITSAFERGRELPASRS